MTLATAFLCLVVASNGVHVDAFAHDPKLDELVQRWKAAPEPSNVRDTALEVVSLLQVSLEHEGSHPATVIRHAAQARGPPALAALSVFAGDGVPPLPLGTPLVIVRPTVGGPLGATTMGILAFSTMGVFAGSVAVILMSELARRRFTSDFHVMKGIGQETQQFVLRAVTFATVVLWMMDFAVIVPGSYDLALEMGHGATVSGILIGSYNLFIAVGAVAAGGLQQSLPYSTIRRITVMCLLLMATLQLVTCGVLRSSFHQKLFPLLACRCCGGLFSGASIQLVTVMALQTMPRRDMVLFTIITTGGRNMGLCMGALLSSAMIISIGGDGPTSSPYVRVTAPLLVMASLWAGVAAWFAVLVPPCLDPLVAIAAAADEQDDRLPRGRFRGGLGSAPLPGEEGRMATVVLCAMYGLVQSFALCAIEVAGTYMVQIDYDWSAQNVGYGLSALCIFSTSWLVASVAMLRRGGIGEPSYLVVIGVLPLLAAILLFDAGGLLKFIAATFVIDACMFTSNAIADGLGNRSTMEGTPYSLANFNMAKTAGCAVSRGMAAPITRAVVASFGRGVFASWLMAALLTAFTLIAIVHRHWSSNDRGAQGLLADARLPSAAHRE